LEAMGAAAFPFAPEAVTAESAGQRLIVRVPLEADEHLFGFGLQFLKLNQRGRTRYLRVNSDPRQDTGETHAPVPFYVSSRGYGALLNTARIATVCCGSSVRADSRRPPAIRDRGRDPAWEATPQSDLLEMVFDGEDAE